MRLRIEWRVLERNTIPATIHVEQPQTQCTRSGFIRTSEQEKGQAKALELFTSVRGASIQQPSGRNQHLHPTSNSKGKHEASASASNSKDEHEASASAFHAIEQSRPAPSYLGQIRRLRSLYDRNGSTLTTCKGPG